MCHFVDPNPRPDYGSQAPPNALEDPPSKRKPDVLPRPANQQSLRSLARGAELRLAFAAIALLAFGLRFWHLGLTTFGPDEAVLVQIAENWVRAAQFPLSGPLSSIGLSTSAHYIYLIAPVVAVSRDPTAVAGLMAIFGTAGVVTTMFLGWRAFGPLAGLVAGFQFAVNPVAVAYSRRIWQPDPLPTLAALFLLALDLALIGRRVWWAAATFPLAALATLVHVSFAPLAALLLAPAVMLAAARRWLALAIGVAAALVITTPFVLYEFSTAWKDYPDFRYYSSLHTFVDLDALRWLLAITTGWMLPNDAVVPPPQRVLPQGIIDVSANLALALFVGSVAVAGLAVVRSTSDSRRTTRIRLAGLLLCMTLPIASSIRHWQPLVLHYFFAFLPAAFLLIASACSGRLFARSGVARIGRGLALSAVLMVGAVQIGWTMGGLGFQAQVVGGDACFLTSIDAARTQAFQLAEFGHASGSSAAVVELDAADSIAMAYLLRADFSDVNLPHPVVSSQNPKLFGNVGLHRRLPSQSLKQELDGKGQTLLTSTTDPEVQYSNGVALHNILFSARSGPDQRVMIAMNWTADGSSSRPVVWRATLEDSAGRDLQTDSGDSFVPANLPSQALVSWFSIDTRRVIAPDERAPGNYQVAIELIDTFGAPPSALPYSEASGISAQVLRLPVEIGPMRHCDLPSVIP